MRVRSMMMFACSAFALGTAAHAQSTPDATGQAADVQVSDQEIIVTARKREETLRDVPVAATAITGAIIEKRGFTAVREIATITPSVNINSDGAGRAFVSIRGIGTTLIDTVQPGVGIFVDGIYQPNTSYLNNPLTDVERVEEAVAVGSPTPEPVAEVPLAVGCPAAAHRPGGAGGCVLLSY